MPTEQAKVISVGISTKNDTVIRILLPNGSIREISTNHVGFAHLAAAGIPVKNDY